METAGFLMSLGIEFGRIIDDSFFIKTYAQQEVQARVIAESRLYLGGRCLVGVLPLRLMHFYRVGPKDIDGIVAVMRETQGVDCAVFVYEIQNGNWKVSFRSNNDRLDVSRAAAAFGGGGHRMAAGCTVPGQAQEVVARVLGLLREQLENAV